MEGRDGDDYEDLGVDKDGGARVGVTRIEQGIKTKWKLETYVSIRNSFLV